jgi:hypothetical protein
MKRSITRWTTTLATAALLGLPAVSSAQTPSPQQPPTQQQPPTSQPPAEQPPAHQPPAQPPSEQPPTPQPPTQQPPSQQPPTEVPPAQQPPTEQPATRPSTPQSPTMAQGSGDATASPQEHLRQAKTALDSIPATAVTGRARTQLAELKRHMNALERASAAPSASTGAPRATSGTAARVNANANWGTEVAAIDKILTEMTATDTATGTGAITGTTGTSGNTRPTATAGNRSKAAAAVALDDATLAKLMEVRTHVVAYATSMSAPQTAPKGTEQATAGDAPAATATPSAVTATNATAGSQDSHATAGAPASAPAPAASADNSRTQVDQEAVRRHLTEARDTLAEITKLPAAAQLTGEARTQVSQLISNFNELITTQSNWTASYAKVEANLNALLGPAEASDASAPAPAPAPAPDATTQAATPVGTSGTASVELDPAIRAKLVQLRTNLTDFQKAAGTK